jgi:dTDP-4-amino-4,6-dideoxygalactose transaminase
MGRDQFIQALSAEGIGTSVHFIPLHLQPFWRDRYDLRPEQFPEATRVYENTVSLPIYTRMTEADQSRVIQAVRSLLLTNNARKTHSQEPADVVQACH